MKSPLDLNNFENEFRGLDAEELGLYFINKLSKVNEGESIKLPDRHITIKYLHIPRSCKIIGGPETVLEITGAILIGTFEVNGENWDDLVSIDDDAVIVHF